MKLQFLILVIALIIFGYWLFLKPLIENYTAGTYVITWQKPTNTGGDPNCCSYDWQLCDSTDGADACISPVDFGTVTGLTASTNKAVWGQSYTIRVRSINSVGAGPWASVQVKAGGGSLTSVTFGQSIKPDGSVNAPLTPGSNQISVWVGTKVALAQGLQGELTLTQTRNESIIQTYKTKMTYGDPAGSGTGSFLTTIQNVATLNVNDIFTAVIYVTDSKNQPWADTQGSITVKEGVPGMVSGISWSYQPTGTGAGACSSSSECSDNDICVAGACVVQNVLLVQNFSVSPDGMTGGPVGWYLAWTGQPGAVYEYTIQSASGASLNQSGTSTVENTPMGWYGSALVTGKISSSEEYNITLTPTVGLKKTTKTTISHPNPVQFIFPLVRYNGIPAYVQTEGPTHVIVSGGSNVPPKNAEIFVSTDLKLYYPIARVATDCPVCITNYIGYSGGADTAGTMQNGKAIGVAVNLYSSSNVVSNLEYQYVINDLRR